MKAVVRIRVEAQPRSFILRWPTQLIGMLLVRLGAERLGVRVVSLGYRFSVGGRSVGVSDWVHALEDGTVRAPAGAMVHVGDDGLIYQSSRPLPLPAEPE